MGRGWGTGPEWPKHLLSCLGPSQASVLHRPQWALSPRAHSTPGILHAKLVSEKTPPGSLWPGCLAVYNEILSLLLVPPTLAAPSHVPLPCYVRLCHLGALCLEPSLPCPRDSHLSSLSPVTVDRPLSAPLALEPVPKWLFNECSRVPNQKATAAKPPPHGCQRLRPSCRMLDRLEFSAEKNVSGYNFVCPRSCYFESWVGPVLSRFPCVLSRS